MPSVVAPSVVAPLRRATFFAIGAASKFKMKISERTKENFKNIENWMGRWASSIKPARRDYLLELDQAYKLYDNKYTSIIDIYFYEYFH